MPPVANQDPPGASGPESQSPSVPAGTANLDFDKAAYAGPVTARLCAACKQGIASEYYEVAGHVICSRCRDRVVGATGDRWAFWRALLYGGLAGIAGTVLWSLIIHLTDREWGIIAIVVGIAVGIAVRKGSRGRGGWKYQALAMVLTYVSITTSYVPLIVKGLVKGVQDHAPAAAGQSQPESKSLVADEATPAKASAPAIKAGPEAPSLPAPLALLAFVALVWGLALAAPFLAGTSNIIGIIIIAVALYEAWRYNRAVKVRGPFRLVPLARAAPTGILSP
jgi:hypothetical protein